MTMIKRFILFLCIAASLLASCSAPHRSKAVLVHAHRGGAAIYPENTIEAMLYAVDLGVDYLEFDLHVSKDSQVVVSHDAYFNSQKALTPSGDTIARDSDKLYRLWNMPYDSIRRYDIGSKANPHYPNRHNFVARLPLADALIDSVETHIRVCHLKPVQYNIEIKSWPTKDGIFTPDYKTFADLCMKELLSHHIGDRLLVQCFDTRTLNYLHQKYPTVRLSYLVDNDNQTSFSDYMSRLDFVPQVYSPHYSLVNTALVDSCRAYGMALAPWTVDSHKDIRRLAALGVDAIITNQPDSAIIWLKK